MNTSTMILLVLSLGTFLVGAGAIVFGFLGAPRNQFGIKMRCLGVLAFFLGGALWFYAIHLGGQRDLTSPSAPTAHQTKPQLTN